MIWDRWRRRLHHGVPFPPLDPFEDLLEHAPVMALLVDRARMEGFVVFDYAPR